MLRGVCRTFIITKGRDPPKQSETDGFELRQVARRVARRRRDHTHQIIKLSQSSGGTSSGLTEQ